VRRFAVSDRAATWLERWGGILPLLLAEFIVWLGFGALLPVLPLYFTEQGVDLAMLGVVIAAGRRPARQRDSSAGLRIGRRASL
jgi:hypothetical protein